jgi:transglutaminase-like putative cysteine protease
MKYRVRHSTTYVYSEMVNLCHNEVHLTPRNAVHQTRSSMQLEVLPEPAVMADHVDFFGNNASFFTVQERHQELQVTATSDVEVLSSSPAVPGLTPAWEEVRASLSGEEIHKHFDAIQFLDESAYVKKGPQLAEYALQSFTPHRPIFEAAQDLTKRIHTDFKYDKNATNLHTSVQEVFEMKRGVCQDFAHVQLSCLRSLGLAARYVSGYLMTMPPAGQKRLVGADASHAWISFYCPGFGWIDMDPTNDMVPGDKHVLLGWGRDYADVSPIKGVILGGGKHIIRVSVDVQPK